LTYYEIFDLDRKLTIDSGDLQKRFYDLSRQYHPDRSQTKSAAEQQAVLDKSSLLNDAYRVLRDPIQRAEYVLKQAGFDIGEQRSKDVPPELLEEVFELNMALEELRSGDDSARDQLEQAREKFIGMRDEIDAGLSKLFAKYDAAKDRESLAEIRAVLNRRRYIRNLVNEVEKELNVDIPN
jgi:molecular chaperone HscB